MICGLTILKRGFGNQFKFLTKMFSNQEAASQQIFLKIKYLYLEACFQSKISNHQINC